MSLIKSVEVLTILLYNFENVNIENLSNSHIQIRKESFTKDEQKWFVDGKYQEVVDDLMNRENWLYDEINSRAWRYA